MLHRDRRSLCPLGKEGVGKITRNVLETVRVRIQIRVGVGAIRVGLRGKGSFPADVDENGTTRLKILEIRVVALGESSGLALVEMVQALPMVVELWETRVLLYGGFRRCVEHLLAEEHASRS